MTKTWFITDPHFGHANILTFKNNEGNPLRSFDSIEQHDQHIVDCVNSCVKPQDRLYIMGDVSMKRTHIATVGRMNGRKKLLKGNHDIFKLKDYAEYFEDISAYRFYPQHGIIFSHIPVAKQQLEHRFKFNVHGHLHCNVIDDKQYMNICPEIVGYKPLDFDEIVSKMESVLAE